MAEVDTKTVKKAAVKPWNELTPETRANLINRYNGYWAVIFSEEKMSKIPEAYIKWAYEHDADQGLLALHLKQTNPKLYLKSTAAKTRGKDLKAQLINIFGTGYQFGKDKQLTRMLERWMLGDATANLGRFIAENITGTKAWKDLPNSEFFSTYLRVNQIYDVSNFAAVFQEYQQWYSQKQQQFEESYKSIYGADAKLPPEALRLALTNGWEVNGIEWRKYLTSDPKFATSEGAKLSDRDFTDNWKALFGDKVPVDQQLLAQYRTFSSEGPKWDSFFSAYIKPSVAFQQAYPGYGAWEDKQHAQGNLEGSPAASISAYLAARQDYIDDYKDLFGVDKNPPPDLIERALREDWSTAQFRNWIMKNDPNVTETDEYKGKVESFKSWWQNLFGETVPIDANLAASYAASGSNDPSSMWNAVKNTATFQSMFPSWDTFARAQAEEGINVTENPLLYNQYKAGLKQAFADIGMQVPDGMESQFWSSGIDPSRLSSNLETFDRTQEAYGWQTGGQANLATGAGLADKAAGGDLRKRMERALAQHKTYANSEWGRYERDENRAGQMTRKI